jgi:hypothetical protein
MLAPASQTQELRAMSPEHLLLAAILLLAAATVCSAAETTVTKMVETFDEGSWVADPWAKAPVQTKIEEENGNRCLVAEVAFAGDGFAWSAAAPAATLTIPGETRVISVRAKTSDTRYPFTLKFKDGWGRTEANKVKFEYTVPLKQANEWVAAKFNVPKDWVQPLSFEGIATHNWEAQGQKLALRMQLDDLEVTTDLTNVDPATGALKTWKPDDQEKDPKKKLDKAPASPLISAAFSSTAVYHAFSRQKPTFTVEVRNWRAGKLTGQARCKVLDEAGKTVTEKQEALEVDHLKRLVLPLDVPAYGRYVLESEIKLGDEAPQTEKVTFAWLPPYPELTPAQKLASPYGMNVHMGNEKIKLDAFRNAGLVWYRDYAWSYDWLVRAKGKDKTYAGWPYYPSILKRFTDLGVMVVPCIQGSIRKPEVKDGKIAGPLGPDRAWTREIVDLLNAFPTITHWELSNEYDLPKDNAEAEDLCDWGNYRAYHKKFAEIVKLIGNGELVAVENGRADIWQGRLAGCIRSGDFKEIGVVNGHHYCGVEPPEINIGNRNTGFEGRAAQAAATFFDQLRQMKRTGVSDGQQRQSWLTEFGWDTLAGFVVSPHEQAAYLPRAYLLSLAAGTDKSFWFYDFDSPKPAQFFDGCGLLGPDGGPKLSLCAMAGLTSILPTPKYVGPINVGENTFGYVFENAGKPVAALWVIEGDSGPEVTFQAEQLVDYFGNPLPGKKAKLRMAPVYATGLSKSDPLYLQSAYDIDTPHLAVVTAGESVTTEILIKNNRDAALQGKLKLVLPEGWTTDRAEATAEVQPGQQARVPFSFTVAKEESIGLKTVKIAVTEGAALKEMPLKVLVQPPLIMQVGPMRGKPGKTEITVKVGNKTAKPLDGELKLALPSTWKADAPTLKVEALKPGEAREIKCAFEWSTSWPPEEKASASFSAGGHTIAQPILPNAYRIHKAPALKLDGQLDDWPASTRLPDWMLGSSQGAPDAEVHLAWSSEGLYVGLEVKGSKVQVADPRSFWNGDCLELFIDTADDKRHREYEPGDHQFWFVPQPDQNRVFAGQWKRKSEIPETKYDLKEVKGSAVKTADGYRMEFLLPTAVLQKFNPKAGSRIGLNLNLTVQGMRFNRDVYWPWVKDWGVQNLPKNWGTLELAE